MAPTEVDNRPAKSPEEELTPPDLYQFGNPPIPKLGEQKSGPVAASENVTELHFSPVGADWARQFNQSERRIENMPEGPAKELAYERETRLMYSVPKALIPYREDIKAADSINQVETVARGRTNVSAQNLLEAQISTARAGGATQEQMNSLLQQQQKLKAELRDITADYLAPGTTRANAGFALISTGNERLIKQGRDLVDDALKLRPELAKNKHFLQAAEAATKAAHANRERALNGGSLGPNDPYQWSGDGNSGVPGGIPPRGPGVPGKPGRGPDGHALPDGNPGFFHVPGGDAQGVSPSDRQVPPGGIPPFVRGPATPESALPKPKNPVEDFTPPVKEPSKGVDKGVWDKMSDSQKMLAIAAAAYLGYRLVQSGNRVIAERLRNQGNEALAQNPENAARLREAIERTGQDVARDSVVKAEQIKEGEHSGKYKVTGRDGKEAFLTEAEFKEKYAETGKPGEYKSLESGRAKAVQLPDLAEMNQELGLGKQADRKMWAVVENGEVKLLTDREFKQNWRQPNEADKASWMTPEERAAKVETERVAAEQKAAAEKAAAEKAAAEKAAAEKAAAEKAAAEKAAAEKAAAEKAAAEKAAAEKAAAEKAAAEKAEADRIAAEQKAAAEKAAAEKAEADRIAAEQKAAAEKAAAEKAAAEKAAAEKAAAEKAAAEKAAAEKAAAEKAAAEKAAAEKAAAEKAAAEKAAAEKASAEKAAAEKAAAEKAAAEKAAAEKATAEKAAAEKAAAEKAAAEKAAAEKAAAEKAAAEKAEADRIAAEQKAAAEKAAAEKAAAEKAAAEKAAAEKAAAEKAEADRIAAEKVASEGRFKPTAGAEIVPGIKVGQTATVDGANWTAVGKVEDRVIVKNESGITRGTQGQALDSANFNRVEVNGQSGVYFQRKGTNSIYQYFPMDGKQGAQPGPGNGLLFKMEGIEARPMGSPIVKAMMNPASVKVAPVAEVPRAPETEGPRRPRRGSGPSAERISGVDYTAAPDGTMTRNPESVGTRLIGTEATSKELLVADEVKMLEGRVRELEAKEKDSKIEAKERVELAAHRYVLENLHNREVHKALIEKMAASRPRGGFKIGEVRSGAVGVAIIATAALGFYLSTRPQEEYTAPDRARLGGS
jgi:hypothetical protein